ncbi:MAG: hypothetical protein P8100_04750 [bacterium]
MNNKEKNHLLILKKLSVLLILTGLLGSPGCDTQVRKNEKEKAKIGQRDHAVEIITETMDFQMPDTIQSGWQTFRYVNKSYETHFFLLDKYPEGKTIEDGEKEILPPFQEGMDLINAGKPEAAGAAFGQVPEWFSKVVFSGGSGLISPGDTAMTTLKLEPGYYVVECYVKMQNGIFHSVMGMVKKLIVTADSTGQSPPKADVKIEISSTEGITVDGKVSKGRQTFAVHFKDQIVHENFVGHDVNLVKLDEHADLAVLEKWMNWLDPEGLITPSPEGFTFLGGVNDMPEGSTGYFSAHLNPGRYALISEVPNTSDKNMLKTFEVSN